MAIDENGKVTFTEQEQQAVDRIVQERLSRHKPDDYDDLQEVARELEDFGYTGTAAEKKAAVKAYKAELKAQQELEALQREAETTGRDPELMKEMKALKDELKEMKGERTAQKQAEEQKKVADAAWTHQVQELEEAFPDVDLEKLNANERFIKFIKGKSLPLKEVYEDFIELVGETAAEALVKARSKEERSTSGGKSAKNSDGNTHGLTEVQKKEVDNWNKRYPKMPMSYKEYANR